MSASNKEDAGPGTWVRRSCVGKNFEYRSNPSHDLTDCADTNCDDDPALPGPESVPLLAPSRWIRGAVGC